MRTYVGVWVRGRLPGRVEVVLYQSDRFSTAFLPETESPSHKDPCLHDSQSIIDLTLRIEDSIQFMIKYHGR